MATPIRVLLADDHEVVRNGLRLMINNFDGWEICGEASTGREAVALAEKLKPHIVVLDVNMPEMNGIEATRQIKRRLPEIEIMLVTGVRDDAVVKAAFEAGARSYLSKTDSSEHFVAAFEALRNHKAYFTPEVAEIVFQRFCTGASGPKEHAATAGLTEREREIVQLLVEGSSNKEVATKLGISEKTVETHRAAVMRKLKLKVFSELVRWAIRNNVIEA